jgi:hypothetical protein
MQEKLKRNGKMELGTNFSSNSKDFLKAKASHVKKMF